MNCNLFNTISSSFIVTCVLDLMDLTEFMPQSLIMFLPYTLSAQLNRQEAALQMQKEDTSIPGQLVHQ